jgi:hypothetical protein
MVIEILGRKEYDTRFGSDTFAHVQQEYKDHRCVVNGNHTIFTRGRPTTGTMLHELYHAARSPYRERATYYSTPYEIALEELSASEYVQIVKRNESAITGNQVKNVVKYLVSRRYTKATVMGAMMRALREMGYSITNDHEYRHELWEYICKEVGETYEIAS